MTGLKKVDTGFEICFRSHASLEHQISHASWYFLLFENVVLPALLPRRFSANSKNLTVIQKWFSVYLELGALILGRYIIHLYFELISHENHWFGFPERTMCTITTSNRGAKIQAKNFKSELLRLKRVPSFSSFWAWHFQIIPLVPAVNRISSRYTMSRFNFVITN